MISSPQRRKFFPLQHRAWLAQAGRVGMDPRDRVREDSWYRAELESVCQVISVKDLDPVDGFDEIMLHWAEIAGDDVEIGYWSRARERRMMRRVRLAMEQLSRLEKRTIQWGYIRAIYDHMHLPQNMTDCPAELLWKLYQALDTHIRRLRRKTAA